MDSRNYWLLLRKNQFSIFVLITLSVLLSLYFTSIQTPIYTAEAQLYVSIPTNAIDPTSNQIAQLQAGGSFTEARVFSYSQIINSPEVIEKVRNDLNLKIDLISLASKITADAPPNSVLINLYVKDTNANLAAKIANSVAINFALLVQKLEVVVSSTTAKDSGAVSVQLVKPANAPQFPTSPKIALNLSLGFILGTLLSISIALLRRFFENKVKNESHLQEVPLIGTLNYDRTVRRYPLIFNSHEFSKRNEAFRILRANVLNRINNSERPIKVVSLISSLAKEGKTSTVINFGISLAQSGLKILAIETDLRKPTFTTYAKEINLENPGSNIVKMLDLYGAENSSKNSSITFETHYQLFPGLDLIASPNNVSNPTELLASGALKRLIDSKRDSYDLILLDTSPALLVADAIVVSKYVDTVLIVVAAGKTAIDVYAALLNLLKGSNVDVLGAILNKVPRDRLGEYGYSLASGQTSSGYYGYGYYIPVNEYYTKKEFWLKRFLSSKNKWNFFQNIFLPKLKLLKKIKIFSLFFAKSNYSDIEPSSSGLSQDSLSSAFNSEIFNIEEFLDSVVKKKVVKKKVVKKKVVKKKVVRKKNT